MKDQTTRRGLLATVGVGSVALAGCTSTLSSLGGSSGDRSTPTTDSEGSTTTPDGTTTDDGGASQTQANDQNKQPQFQRGEVLEDFEDLENWLPIVGDMKADTERVYAGSQSVRLEAKGDSAGMWRGFTDGLDLTKQDLSVAAKLEAPAKGKVVLDLYAPGERNHAVARRFIPKDLDGWIRFDIGYTNEPGEPEMSDVRELRFVVHPRDGSDVKVNLDDLRLIPKESQKGRVMLTFDDNFDSHYDYAFQEMEKRGWKGVTATIPSFIGDEGRMSIGELREMHDAGWDVAAHPQLMNPIRPLPTLSEKNQRKAMEQTNKWLEMKGFPEAKKYFITPFDRMGDTTHELVSEMYEQAYLFGACNNSTLPTGRHNISRVYGVSDGLHETWVQLKLANRRSQMTVLAFHDIGPEGEITQKDFDSLLNTIEKLDLEVVTPSDLQKEY